MRLWGFVFASREGTKKSLQELVGNWNPALLFRRPAFCLFDNVFSFINRAPDSRKVPLPFGVTDEILHTLVFAPLLFTDLGAPLSSSVLATDASGGEQRGLGQPAHQ